MMVSFDKYLWSGKKKTRYVLYVRFYLMRAKNSDAKTNVISNSIFRGITDSLSEMQQHHNSYNWDFVFRKIK